MNLKITLLSALVISASTLTIKAMSDEEKAKAIEEIELSIEAIALINRPNIAGFKAFSPEGKELCKITFTHSKKHYIDVYSSVMKKLQNNIIPKTDDPHINILFTVSRKVAPLSMAITCLRAIEKIDAILETMSQK